MWHEIVRELLRASLVPHAQDGVMDPVHTRSPWWLLRPASADLSWIPVGAGAPVVRTCSRGYEALCARLQRRARRDMYHAALQLWVDGRRVVIELTPVPDDFGARRGVTVVGPVGARWAGRWRLFRYELRCWSDGTIPDIEYAVDVPIRLTDDPAIVARIVESTAHVPTLTWGRDEIGVGDMWNSNSAISWLLERSGIDATAVPLPRGGAAPGWLAGIAAARRRSAARVSSRPGR